MKEKNMYLHELEIYDGEAFIVFNIISLSMKKGEITLALTNRGKISVVTYDLRSDEKGLYFEYGCEYAKLRIKDFKEAIEKLND